MKKTILTLFTALVTTIGFTQNSGVQEILNNSDKHFFIENKGQWDDDVMFLCRLGGLDVWITKYGINYTFIKIEETKENTIEEEISKGKLDQEKVKNTIVLGHRVLMKLQNHNPQQQQEGKQKQQGCYNYFIGNDSNKHASFVGLYKEALIKNVYNGIDLRYYFDQGTLRYDYIVHPGADPSQIQFILDGQEDVYLKEGDLYFTTRFGEVAMAELYTYQGDKKIESRFEKQGKVWKINIGNYNPNQDLIIDPLLFSTYIGGSSGESGKAIDIDGNGNSYVTGRIYSTDYDITPGAFQTTFGGGAFDTFVTKLNADGNTLHYSTYIGGSNNEYGEGIEIDGSGNAYITGFTSSSDYAITPGAYQTTFGGGTYDVFVTKLNASGGALLYSTYIGGSNNEDSQDITLDISGNAYITGTTWSTDYDVTLGAFQTALEGTHDVFVTKLNSNGNALLYSTLLGGSCYEQGHAIEVDDSGNAYVTGVTCSADYDITNGAFQTTFEGGSWDVFVTKLNTSGNALLYSTYIGGNNDDLAYFMTVDSAGNAYVTGKTRSANYDVTPGAFQTTLDGNHDIFVTNLNTDGSALLYSTYIGGSNNDIAYSMVVDSIGNAYITGYTESTDYDITPGAFQTTFGGGWDVFFTKLSASGNTLHYSTYIGGSNDDFSYGIEVDRNGNAFITGLTYSTDYHITPGAFQTTLEGSHDVFVTKLDTICSNTTSTIAPIVCNSYTSPSGNYTWTTSGTYTDTIPNSAGCESIFIINLTVNTTTTSTITPIVCSSYTSPSGNYTWSTSGTYKDTISNVAGCDSIITINLTVNNATTSTISPTVCKNYTSPSGNYIWSSSGTYTDTILNINGCDSIITINLTVNTVDISVINKDPILTANAANASYQWVTCPNYSPITGAIGQTFTPTANGSYAVIVTQNGCMDTSACETVTSVGIQEFLGKYVVQVYPNPTTGKFTIELVKNFTGLEVNVTNTLGQLVNQEKYISAQKIPITLNNIDNGIYFVQIYSDNNLIASFKIRKQ